MIRTKDILSSSFRTEEILSRYRPIAPKPLICPQNSLLQHPVNDGRQPSSCLRRSRKRRGARIPSAGLKKAKRTITHLTSFSPDAPPPLAKKTQVGLSLHAFARGSSGFPFPSPGFRENPAASKNLVTVPPLSRACSAVADTLARKALAANDAGDMVGLSLFPSIRERALDLNSKPEIPEEKDLLHKLQTPFPIPGGSAAIIMPQPVRPVGSSISVECISESESSCSAVAPVCKRAEEVEEEVESDSWPSVISDSKNKVRLANSAYKELVGQPECSWLDSMVVRDGSRREAPPTASKRISGEVVLDLSETSVPIFSNGFSCRAKIEWASNGRKIFISAPCDVIRLSCQAKDYLFTWKFLIPTSKA